MQQNMAALAEIKDRQEKLMGDALQLQQDMLDFRYMLLITSIFLKLFPNHQSH